MPKNATNKFRKKKGAQSVDFKRPKVKVGRKLKPANCTDTSFQASKISLRTQRAFDEKGDVVTKRNLNLKDLLPQLKHYSAGARKDALWGLKELCAVQGGIILAGDTLGQLLVSTVELVVDNDTEVRKALLTLMETLLSHVEPSAGTSFMKLFVAFVGSAMTNLESDVRLDAVKFASLLLNWSPRAVGVYEMSLLPNYTALLKGTLKMVTASNNAGFAIAPNKPSGVGAKGDNSDHVGGGGRNKKMVVLSNLNEVVGGILRLVSSGKDRMERTTPAALSSNSRTRHVEWSPLQQNQLCPLYDNPHRIPIQQVQESLGIMQQDRIDKNSHDSPSHMLFGMLCPLRDAWEYDIAFLGLDEDERKRGNAKHNCSVDQARLVLQTLIVIVRIVDIVLERLECAEMLVLESKTKVLRFARSFQGVLLSTFPFKRTSGVLGLLVGDEVSVLNASMCNALCRGGTLFKDKQLVQAQAKHIFQQRGGRETDAVEEEIWGVPVANFLSDAFAKEAASIAAPSMTDGDSTRSPSQGGGIVALIKVLPTLLYRIQGYILKPVFVGLTRLFQALSLDSPALHPCLSIFLHLINAIIAARQRAVDHGIEPSMTIQCWVDALPKLIWGLGRKQDEVGVVQSLSILRTVLSMSGGSNFLSLDMTETATSMSKLAPFFYTRSEVSKREQYGPFIAMNRSTQQDAINLVYYIPNVTDKLLRALAVCVNHRSVTKQNKQLILELMFHRKDDLGAVMYLSFLISALLDLNEAASKDVNGTVLTEDQKTANRLETIGLVCDLLINCIGEDLLIKAFFDKLLELSAQMLDKKVRGKNEEHRHGLDIFAIVSGLVVSVISLGSVDSVDTEGGVSFLSKNHLHGVAAVLVATMGFEVISDIKTRIAPIYQLLTSGKPITGVCLETFLHAFADRALTQPGNLDQCERQLICLRALLADTKFQEVLQSPEDGFPLVLWRLLMNAFKVFLQNPGCIGLHDRASALKMEVEMLRVEDTY
eukprot:Stramenopile-MAST_4_protein_188